MRLAKAMEMAAVLYEYAYWPDGTPKIIHPVQVMGETARNSSATERTLCIAILHDALEDFPESAKMIRHYTADIAVELDLLTRRPMEPYFDYIGRILSSNNEDALLVKLSDAEVNIKRPGITPKHKERYMRAIKLLLKGWRNARQPEGKHDQATRQENAEAAQEDRRLLHQRGRGL